MADAVAVRAEQRALEAEWVRRGGVEPGSVWPSAWFPLCVRDGSPSRIVVDLDANDAESAVIHVDKEGPDPWRTSLAGVIRFWISCLDRGLYRWQEGRWTRQQVAVVAAPFPNYYH